LPPLFQDEKAIHGGTDSRPSGKSRRNRCHSEKPILEAHFQVATFFFAIADDCATARAQAPDVATVSAHKKLQQLFFSERQRRGPSTLTTGCIVAV
jgi:hypothetical protein